MDAAPRDWIDGFLAHLLNERRVSVHTIAAYRQDLRALDDFRKSRNVIDWNAVDHACVRAFAAADHAGGLAPRSIQRRLSAVRTFYAYLQREEFSRHNPATDVRAPTANRRLPTLLDTDQMGRLLAFRVTDALSSRDKAIMELFYSSGLRLDELVSLNLGSVDLSDRTVRVHGKGGKARIVPVGRHAIDALRAWLAERPGMTRRGLSVPAETALFLGRGGQRLKARAIQLRVAAWARKQGLAAHVHPHMFRHSFATHLLESSGNLRGVQELLGHADIGTTQIYTHLDFQHLALVYDATHPRARKRQ